MAVQSDKPRIPGKRGPKPGSPQRGGIPKGTILPKTLQKEEGKALLREMVLSELRPIVRGLIKKAQGVDHMMLRDDEGRWKRMETEQEIAAALNAKGAEEGKTFWIHTKDPDVQAAADILNRAIGKPVEEQNVTLTVNEPLSERIKRTKKRLGL